MVKRRDLSTENAERRVIEGAPSVAADPASSDPPIGGDRPTGPDLGVTAPAAPDPNAAPSGQERLSVPDIPFELGTLGPSPALDRMAAMLPDTILFQLVTEMTSKGENRYLVFLGRNVERLLGLPHDLVMEDGRIVYTLIDSADLAHLQHVEIAAVRERSNFRVRLNFTLPDGRRRVFDISAAPTRLGAARLLWDGVVTDVTDEAMRTAERDRLTELVEAADDLIAVVRPNGRIDYLNAAGRRLLGLDDVSRLPRADALWPEGDGAFRLRHAIRTATRNGLWRGDGFVRRPDGTEMPVTQAIVAHRSSERRRDGKPSRRVTHFSVIMRDGTRAADTERALREAGDRTSIELGEIAHRVKNLFALVPAIIALSARTATSVEALAATARERVEALASAHAMTLDTSVLGNDVPLADLAEVILRPYAEVGETIALDGSRQAVKGATASTIALVLHELATNAVKYGALREREDGSAHGQVALGWSQEATDWNGEPSPIIRVEWSETGGPPVREPNRQGFGTSLIDRVVTTHGGRIDRDWRESGLKVVITLPSE